MVPTIAIMTDFGIKDGNVGVMKGVIWGICPQAHIADISHMIRAQDIREAALILSRSVPYFPPGTIHLVVVDPGVGTARRPMAARIGSQFYVGPDNGLITLWLQRARAEGQNLRFVNLNNPRYWLSDISHVFHGRDIFAPCAAHLARGVPLEDLGSLIEEPAEVALPRPTRVRDGWDGEVIHIDHFGNVASNLRVEDLSGLLRKKHAAHISLGGAEIHGIVDTFGDRPPGELVALLGSTGNLIVSVVNGNAASALGVHVGDKFVVRVDESEAGQTS
ncbi:MAG TPA: SAM-dependent chlorinase/fluorinase [Anaerolineales bacterium]